MHQEPFMEKMMVEKANRNHIPLSGSFELLPMCNMSCRMCYLKLSREETERMGGLRSMREWLSLAQEMAEAGTLFLLLTGGEPLLYPDFQPLYTALRNMGFIITINTNGTLLDEKMADFLAENKPRRVNVTLYGASNDTYHKICGNPNGYTQTIRAIHLLKEREIATKLNLTLVPENLNELERFHEIAAELELPMDVNTYVVPACRERENPFPQETRLGPDVAAQAYVKMLELQLGDKFGSHVQQRLQELKSFSQNRMPAAMGAGMRCRAGRSTAWISWQGDLIPCSFMNEPRINVFENGFQRSWDKFLPMIEQIVLPTECSNCDLRCLCPACAAFGKSDTGSVSGKPEYLCRYTMHIVELMKEKVIRYEKESELHIT